MMSDWQVAVFGRAVFVSCALDCWGYPVHGVVSLSCARCVAMTRWMWWTLVCLLSPSLSIPSFLSHTLTLSSSSGPAIPTSPFAIIHQGQRHARSVQARG
ncbi:hypothetical protein B0H14DRAFT_2749940 [Mycena olivaceomarginata]|nr:hypothetical protein B0H14DRAFT_2749940 [Mycena olivaceomarginata]